MEKRIHVGIADVEMLLKFVVDMSQDRTRRLAEVVPCLTIGFWPSQPNVLCGSARTHAPVLRMQYDPAMLHAQQLLHIQEKGGVTVANTSAPAAKTSTGVNGKRFGLAVLAAAVLNLIAYAVGSLAGASWVANGQSITWIMVILATLFPMAVGGAITYLLSRRWGKATTVMAWIGLAFGIVTLPAPLFAAENAAAGLSLASMHVITGVVWFLAVRPGRSVVAG